MTECITKSEATACLTAERSYWREEDTPDLPETLTLELTADEMAAVHEARAFLRRNPAIHSVNVSCTPPEIESWRYDVSYISVFRDVGSYLFLQGKYDCSAQVEYSVEI
ncbi:MAG TPA: hypothetical protein VKA18_08685 [Alphaproteobacteria bacterium]|nr:hypothetical protein [Alphaproteobacteria bacterium]HMA98109.1 hypothetical protein [Wenzhouxiangella sp.]